MEAGKLNKRVAFDAPKKVKDGHGGAQNGFADDADATKVWANFRYLRGGEIVQAERLAGRQPIVITVRNSPQSRAIDASWRMRYSAGESYNIRSGPVPSDNRLYLEFTVEGGVAV